MRFDIMTLFPEMIDDILSVSIIGRAREKGIISINTYNIRDYSKDKHKKVDDTLYGGGKGLLMTPGPIYDCFADICSRCEKKPYLIYMSPKGKLLDEKTAKRLSEKENIAILCGHYEGVDERIVDLIVDEEISIGDYVLTGGEIPACILVDSVSRLKDGVLADRSSFENESIYKGMLEEPQYTKPEEFMGLKVPEVLLSGNHGEIDRWRKEKAIEKTRKNRPDLI